jgi:predicted kinase
MSLLYKLIDNNFKVNIDEVMLIPEFLKLRDGGYHSKYHMEGDSLTHTLMVVDEVYKLHEWNELNDFEKICLVGAALFHDIGKGVCNKLDDDGINYSAPHHSSIGEKITRYMLWDTPFKVREMICSLVRYHMKPKHFKNKDKSLIQKTILEISHNSNCKLLYLLNKCDRNGTTSLNKSDEVVDCDNFMLECLSLGCFDNSYPFFSEQVKLNYFKSPSGSYEMTEQYSPKFDLTVYIMCGVAGSGKSTYAKNHIIMELLPVISRDLVRIQLGYIDAVNKFKGNHKQGSRVSQIVDAQVDEMLKNCQSFVYDNLNIRKKYRDHFINKIRSFKKYNAKIVIVYIETSKENNISRRRGQINQSQIIKMQQEMDMPQPSECHYLILNRN